MGRQVVKQPNGKFAIFTSICDDFVLMDATQEELLEEVGKEAAERAKEDYLRLMGTIQSQTQAVQTKNWNECLNTLKHVHGVRKMSKRMKYEC